MIPLSQSTVYTLKQLSHLLEQISTEKYTYCLPLLSGNSIGKHVRHIIECYQGLINGLDKEWIDYENRARNLDLEGCPQMAIEALDDIIDQIRFHKKDKEVLLFVNQSHENETNLLVKSTLAREIVFCLEHSIHHMAIIAIAAKNTFPEIDIHPHFGFAYSTIKHLEKTEKVISK